MERGKNGGVYTLSRLVLAFVMLSAAAACTHPAGEPIHTRPHSPAAFTPPAGAPAVSPARREVIVMVFDGLAPALVERAETPNLDRMAREGTSTDAMVPPFPSISLIGGFTISTGCWPARHGIVTNRFLDPERGLYDHASDADWLLDCEGLHEAAERQGVPTATLAWYGEVSGTRGKLAREVNYHPDWQSRPDDRTRAREIAALVARPDDTRPDLILAYLNGPDGAAHFEGIDSATARAATERSDEAVGIVLDAVRAAGRERDTTMIVTTDHGMVPVGEMINAEYLLRANDIEGMALATGTTAFLYLAEGEDIDAVATKLAHYEEFDVLRPGISPELATVGDGPRMGDLVLAARPPHVMEDRSAWPEWLRWVAVTGPTMVDTSGTLPASHGYAPGTPGADVNGVLYAWGSGIPAGRKAGPVRAIDIHPTITHLLGIEPGRPIDGRVSRELLVQPDPR